MAGCATCAEPDHLPNLRPDRQPPHPSWLPRQRRGTTPQMIGRYPDYDVLRRADTGTRPPARWSTPACRPRGRCAFFTAEEEPTPARVLRRGRRPRRRAAGAGGRDGRREARRGAARRLPLRRHARRPRHLAAGAARAGRDGARPVRPGVVRGLRRRATQEAIVGGFADGSADGGALGAARTSRGRGRCACARSWRRSTRTRGRGTRSASADRPTPRATCASGPIQPREPHERPGATAEDPVRVVDERDRRMTAAAAQGRGRPGGQRLALPARRPSPRPARPGHDGAATPSRRGRSVRRRGRRRRSVLAQRLARRGWRVVIIEAGPFWHPDEDWVSDEAGSHQLYWTQERVIGGADPVELGKNNSGRGVGGSMVHYAGYCPAFIPPTSRPNPRRGRRRLADLLRGPQPALRDGRARAAGRRAGLAVGRPPPLPVLPPPGRGGGVSPVAGRDQLGIEMRVGPVGIVNGTFGNRPHCIYRGFCLQGCKVNAKASPYVTHLPDALAHGVEIRANCMAVARRDRRGRAAARPGVTYVRRGRAVERHQRAKALAVAGYSIETPRLLLNSTSRAVPERARQQRRPGRPLRDGPGGLADRGTFPRGAADVQGAAARGFLRAVL